MSRYPVGPHAGVVPADAADLDTISQLIADAFHGLAPSRWLITDPAARRKIFPGYFRLYVEHALAHGVVYTTTDRAASKARNWAVQGLVAAKSRSS
jgi:hypothetical protein